MSRRVLWLQRHDTRVLELLLHSRSPTLTVFMRALTRLGDPLAVVAWTAVPPDRFSFPSGHAATTMALALPLALAFPWPGAGIVLLGAVLVGFSRAYLGLHYPGDVVAGWLLGGLCAGGAAFAFSLSPGP